VSSAGTAAAYLKAAGIALRPPGGWGRQPPAKPANEVTTDFGEELATPPGRSPSASACEPYRETIEVGLSKGRNAMAIWQDLVNTCGFSAGYQSVRRYISKLRPQTPREACVVIEIAPGEEAQASTALAPWCAIRPPAGTAVRGCSC